MSTIFGPTGLKRSIEMAAIFMAGDGLIGLTQPERHVGLWKGAGPLDGLVRRFDGHPGRRRAYGALQLAAGLLLASRLRR